MEDVPTPYAPREAAELTPEERADLETCERAVSGLQTAFTVAGKALATINQARLYKETHSSFAAYVEDRWGMRKSQAYRLIEAWPVAVALSSGPNVSPRGDTSAPPEKHVRALLPVVKRHGLDAARVVYEELREQDARVTTTRVTQAVRVLPARLASPEQARDVLRVAVAEGRMGPVAVPAPAAAPEQAPKGEEERQEARDAAEHEDAVTFGREIRQAADLAEQLGARVAGIAEKAEAGARPLDLGVALTDLSRIRKAAHAVSRVDLTF